MQSEVKTILDVVEIVDRLKKLKQEFPNPDALIKALRYDLYVDVLKCLSNSCSEFVRDICVEALNAEDIK